jgi:DNA-binding MarR family transcriptional regulator
MSEQSGERTESKAGRRGRRPATRVSEPICLGLPDGTPGPAARRLVEGIQLLVRRFAIAERADVNCCGLTVAQSATLEALRAEGPLRLAALGRRLGITPSTLTRNLARLLDARLVTRDSDPEDSRAARVALTAAGRSAAAEVERREEAFARSILDRLPAERQEVVLEALSDLLLAVREATEGCCPGAFDHLLAGFPVPRDRADAARGGRDDCACD